MHRTLSVLAWCVAVAMVALGASATSSAAGERYWRHHGGHIQFGGGHYNPGGGYIRIGGGWGGWGCSGGGTDCPTAINRPRYRGDYWGGHDWRYGEPRIHRKYRGHRKFKPARYLRHYGPHVYLGIPFVVPHIVPVRRHNYSLATAHVQWCKANYRSYRISDNSFKPRAGKPRRQCRSPYL